MADVLTSIRAEVDARFASGEFIPRLLQVAYERSLRTEMKHLWDSTHGSFKGAHEYRMYVLEKIKLAQRERHWEGMADFYHHTSYSNSPSYEDAVLVLAEIANAKKKLAQKRLDIREMIGEIDYD